MTRLPRPDYLEGIVTGALGAVIVLALLQCSDARAEATTRTREARTAFVATQACPATGRHRGRCPGWIVDHVIPLCAGGADAPENMRWQTEERAHAKDRIEFQYCRCLDRAPRGMCARVFEHRLRDFR